MKQPHLIPPTICPNDVPSACLLWESVNAPAVPRQPDTTRRAGAEDKGDTAQQKKSPEHTREAREARLSLSEPARGGRGSAERGHGGRTFTWQPVVFPSASRLEPTCRKDKEGHQVTRGHTLKQSGYQNAKKKRKKKKQTAPG